MMFYRRPRLMGILLCPLLFLPLAVGQQAPAPAQPQSASPAAQQPQQSGQQPQRPPNPFETVPTAPAAPQAPRPAPPSQIRQTRPGQPTQNIIDSIEFRGSRRVPQDTLRALIFTKKGDPYNEETLHRDFIALWNTGRFDDLVLEREPGENGWIIRFVVTERPVIRSIKYEGNKSVTVSEILDRFKERKVGLVVESQYDPNKVQRARNVIQDYEAERGHQYAKVDPEIHRVPPSSIEIVFKVDEGPKVKVGHIEIVGNTVFNDREVIRAMHNLKPIGIPYSIL